MKSKIRIWFLTLIPIIWGSSCNKPSEHLTNVNLLILNVESTYATNQSDDWVVAYDKDGVVLDYLAFETGGILVSSKIIPDSLVTIALLRGVNSKWSVKAYTGVKISSTWTLTMPAADQSPATGASFNVTINDAPAVGDVTLSSEFGQLQQSAVQTGGTISMTIPGQVTETLYSILIRPLADKIKVKYFFSSGEDETFSYTDMDSVDRLLTIKFPLAETTNLSVQVRPDHPDIVERGFSFDRHFGTNETSLQVGYNNGALSYATSLVLIYNGYTLFYSRQGEMPNQDSFAWPTPDGFGATSAALSNGVFRATQPFVYRTSIYSVLDNITNSSAQWEVNSASLTHKIGELPEEIIMKNPILSTEKLAYDGTTFYTKSPALPVIIQSVYGLPLTDLEQISIAID